jgi:thiol-disulfide isomerase/thioredoxin
MKRGTPYLVHRTQYAPENAPARTCLFLATAVIAAAFVGCEPSPSVPAATNSPSSELKLIIGDAKALDGLVAAHQGQVVFVDCWATWCGPCVEGFPHTVELAKKYRDQGLATIAVSFDQLDDEQNVRNFLAAQGANFENLISKHDGVNQRAAIDFDVEALPQYRLYDRRGRLREKWEGKSDEIEQKIQELLAEK